MPAAPPGTPPNLGELFLETTHNRQNLCASGPFCRDGAGSLLKPTHKGLVLECQCMRGCMSGPPHPCAVSSPSTWKVLLALPPEVKACAEAASLKPVLPPLPSVSAQTLLLGGCELRKPLVGGLSPPCLPCPSSAGTSSQHAVWCVCSVNRLQLHLLSRSALVSLAAVTNTPSFLYFCLVWRLGSPGFPGGSRSVLGREGPWLHTQVAESKFWGFLL